MAMEYIPLPTREQTLLETTPTLDGARFTFRFDWNSVEDRWSLSIYDLEGNMVVGGIKLVPMFYLLRNIPAANAPKGDMLINSVSNIEVTRENIGDCQLVYFSAGMF